MKSVTELAEENNCSKKEYVIKYFLEQGCKLIDDYEHCMVPMRYVCKCGNEGKTSWNNFSRKNYRCGLCHSTGRKRRWNIEELVEFYASKGCQLLEKEYSNNKSKLKFICRCGREHSKILSEFKTQPRCLNCYMESRYPNKKVKKEPTKKARKITQEIAENYFKESGCVLLSNYKNSSSHLKYICKCGRESMTVWENFITGKRCGRCGSKRSVKFNLEEVKEIFKESGCEFLDDAYVNNTTSHRFRCSCGEESSIKMQYFRQGVRCAKCKKAKKSGPNHFAWREDRELFSLEMKFKKRVYGFLARCRKKFNTAKEDHADKVLGYTPKCLQSYIMNHSNWDSVKDHDWHLDHIFPLEAFVEHGISDFRIINAMSNLQPILQSENNQKKDKYDESEFLSWLSGFGDGPSLGPTMD